MKKSRITPVNKFLGKNMKRAREFKKLSQQQTATKLRVKLSKYISWEGGRREPPLDYVIKIADVLECQNLYLFLTSEIITLEGKPVIHFPTN